jgi:hypothetical protein
MTETSLNDIYKSVGELTGAVKALGEKIEANENRNVTAIAEANKSRAEVHRRLDDLVDRTSRLEGDTAAMAQTVAGAKAVTDDVKAMRERARGAGTLGQWLIKFGGWVLGVAASVVSFYTYLTGRPPP